MMVTELVGAAPKYDTTHVTPAPGNRSMVFCAAIYASTDGLDTVAWRSLQTPGIGRIIAAVWQAAAAGTRRFGRYARWLTGGCEGSLTAGTDTDPRAIAADALRRLVDLLQLDGYEVIGPIVEDGAITLGPLPQAALLPTGVRDEQGPGRYRLIETGSGALFDHAAPAQPWKRWLLPPRERLWRAEREGGGFAIVEDAPPSRRLALLGVRACDLAAIAALDAVFAAAGAAGRRYFARRDGTLIIAVNCTRAGETCFCASMGTGPRVGNGADLVLTEHAGGEGGSFVAEARGARGHAILARLEAPVASQASRTAAAAAIERTAASMPRAMPAAIRSRLEANLEHPAWGDVGERCLACGNCTMVCPTCFCARFEDKGEPDAGVAERWRAWDSCFSLGFTEMHGGAIRRSRAARYRQWMTHKLASWWEQFGSSGCVGCGRCITWCPVGIDITREAATFVTDVFVTGGEA